MCVYKMKLFAPVILLAIYSVSSTEVPEKKPVKRSYVCPPKFIRQGHRCYFFSKEQATWQDAHFKCQDMHSNIAVIRSPNQDKLIRNFLSRKPLIPLERWIGGVYDWEQMAWKWASSGKLLTYNGFEKLEKEDKEKLRWHCIIMDPSLQYKWSSRSCLEPKHYICHTKIKTVGSKGKKKLQRQYNADKYNKLNEIPVPNIPYNYTNDTTPLKAISPISYQVEINNSLNDQALFANRPTERRRKARKDKKKRKTKKRQLMHFKRNANCTLAEVPISLDKETKINKYNCKENGKPILIQNIRWKHYQKKDNESDSLYPPPIIEEYNFVTER